METKQTAMQTSLVNFKKIYSILQKNEMLSCARKDGIENIQVLQHDDENKLRFSFVFQTKTSMVIWNTLIMACHHPRTNPQTLLNP